jgi:hypothetical protein
MSVDERDARQPTWMKRGNTHLSVRESFLLDFGEVCIVFYFGTDAEVNIPD